MCSAGALKLRDYLMSQVKTNHTNGPDVYYAPTPSLSQTLSLATVSANITDTNSDTNVSDIEYEVTLPTYTPYPTISPYPTSPPYIAPTSAPIQTTVSTGNSNCTTGAGTPNSWYSDVYLSTSTTLVGSAITFSVVIRDCYKNAAPVSDTIKISLNSGDNSVQINGNNLPYTIQTQNGKVDFSLTSANVGTFSFIVEDSTRSFTITDTNNHNPSVTYTNNTSGNSNCTTSANVPNTWYSDVTPASPITVNMGSSTGFTIDIRDCNRNNVSNDMIQLSLNSGDNSVQINGNNLPYTIQAQNGKATFSVTSSNAGTYGFVVRDTTNGFNITDPNNHNPSVIFVSAASPTPQATITPTQGSNPTPTTTNPVPTPTTTSAPAPTITQSIPNPSPT
jgi:hypothetical protein